jgi:hypothetical protein
MIGRDIAGDLHERDHVHGPPAGQHQPRRTDRIDQRVLSPERVDDHPFGLGDRPDPECIRHAVSAQLDHVMGLRVFPVRR